MDIDSEFAKITLLGIAKEFYRDNGYDDNVDYIVTEFCDAIDNFIYCNKTAK